MKPECEHALKSAAGRDLTKAELDGIEERIHSSLRELSMKDHGKYMAMAPHERVTEAAKMAKERMMADVVRAHEQSINEASTKASLQSNLDSVKPGLKGQVHSLKNMIGGLETKVDAMSANFFRLVNGLHEADGGKLFGLIQDSAKQRDIAGALFGEQSSPEAKRAADSLKGMMDTVADRFKRAGLTLNAREDYRTPQPQEPAKVAKAGKDAWVEDHLQWVDRKAYVNSDGRPMADDQLRHMLGESYRSISTDGANRRAEGVTGSGSAMLGSDKNAPRQLFYKNADAWTSAMQKYGKSTSMYELISGHVRMMAKDITTAEQFGRNADDNITQALARAYENDQQAVTGKGVDKLATLQNKTQKLYDAYAHPDRPGNAIWANQMVQLRGLMSSSQLGSLFGALPDLAGMKLAAEHSGLPAIRMFREAASSVFAGKTKMDDLHRLGIWQEGFQHATNRMAEDGYKSGWGTFLNEITHKAMGLNAFDRGMRGGVGLVTMHTLGKFTRSHDTLASAEGEARLLQNHGITEDHWNVWKAAELDKGPSGKDTMLTPDSIYAIKDPRITLDMKDHAAEKLLEAAYGEMQFGARGASRSSLEDRMAMGVHSQADSGTIMGELKRFAMQFKSVPVGIFRNHWQRMQTLDTWGAKTAYSAKFLGYSMLMGALATEIKAMISGQDPRTMNITTPEGQKFWMESMAAGGGMGLYGDLFLNGQTRSGGGVETLMGPGVSAGWDVLKEARQAVTDAENGESKHPYALAGLRWVRKNATPFANLWYAKAAFNRLVYDSLSENLSPGSVDKQAQRMQSKGVSYWWQPGHNAPDRAPNLSRATAAQ
jgi:hypothetical protein